MCLLSFDQTVGPRERLRISSRIQLNKSRLKNSRTSLDVYNKTFWLHRLEGSLLNTQSSERLTVLQNVLQAHTKAGNLERNSCIAVAFHWTYHFSHI